MAAVSVSFSSCFFPVCQQTASLVVGFNHASLMDCVNGNAACQVTRLPYAWSESVETEKSLPR